MSLYWVVGIIGYESFQWQLATRFKINQFDSHPYIVVRFPLSYFWMTIMEGSPSLSLTAQRPECVNDFEHPGK